MDAVRHASCCPACLALSRYPRRAQERLVPHDDNALLARNAAMMGTFAAVLMAASWMLVQGRTLLAL